MSDPVGCIVRATAGREKGQVFCVVGTQEEMLLLADGKRRRLARPKRKKLGHVCCLTHRQNQFDHPVVEKLRQGRTVSNREVRQLLGAFQAQSRRV